MKIEDLTLKEIKQTCEKYNIKKTLCSSKCPIFDACCDYIYGVPSEWTTEDMERDIEGVNKRQEKKQRKFLNIHYITILSGMLKRLMSIYKLSSWLYPLYQPNPNLKR